MRPRLRCLLVLVLAGAVAGCGSASDEGTQPRTDVSTFEQGDFDDIPLLPTSEPLSPPNEEDGTVPAPTWCATPPPARSSTSTWSSWPKPSSWPNRWRSGQHLPGSLAARPGRILTVSATAANNLDAPADFSEGIETFTQYSLSLSPTAGG